MFMILTQRFNYNKLERLDSPDGRKYIIPSGEHVSSVTTILSQTVVDDHIEQWTNRVGKRKAKDIVDEAGALGTIMHEHLEAYVLGKEKNIGTNLNRKLAKKMSDVIIENGFRNVQEVWGSEIQLHYDDLWAGTTDLLGIHCNQESIMDFKTTIKPKKREWIESYFMQISAYTMSHNQMYGTNIRRGVIFMVSRDLTYQEFVIEGDEMEHYQILWAERVSRYYEK